MRKYRNRRVGEFLKELHLTEGRATGVPTITRELNKNGSPEAVFETDADRYYFKTSFKIHSEFNLDTKSLQLTPQVPCKYHASTMQVLCKYVKNSPQVLKVLQFCDDYRLRKEMQEHINLVNRDYFRKKILKPLIENQLLKMSQPDKPNSSKQKYVITEKGKILLEVLEKTE